MKKPLGLSGLFAIVAWPCVLCAQGLEREVAFLTIPSGARVVGVGRAATSLPDPQASFYNPAAVAWARDFHVGIARYDGPLGFLAHRASALLPVSPLGVVQFGLQVQTFGEFELTDASAQGPVGIVEPQNVVVEFGLSQALGEALALGIRGKWVHSGLTGDVAGTTLAADLGLLWRAPSWPLRVGLAVTNLGPGLRVGDGSAVESDPLPTRLRFGVSAEIPLWSAGRAVLSGDLEDAPRDWSAVSEFLGAAIEFRDLLTVRAGFVRETLIETNRGTTFGLGLRLGRLWIDFAREMGVNHLGDEAHLSLEYGL